MEAELEQQRKENLLMEEAKGNFPEWDDMSDQKLVKALQKLSDEEKELIFQHVFQGMTFKEMSLHHHKAASRLQDIYYYAIKKIRKQMGGKNNGV